MNFPKLLIISCAAICALFAPVSAQWIKQTVNTTAGFRGLSVVSEKVIWASGTGGTVIRTVDGGATWKVMTVPGAEKLDFRDIEAFDANTAYILSIGNGASSRIYKTIDGGATWKNQFTNDNAKAFFDAIACWDKDNCIAMSDPVDGEYVLIGTSDGGANWKPIVSNQMPAAKDGEAAFAASGTCLIVKGKTNAFIVSGGNDARVFRSTDRGKTWSVSETKITKGTTGSGIFSIAMMDAKNGVIVGGNYEKPNEMTNNLAFTNDAGKSWVLGIGLTGYRSAVTYVDKKTIVAVGSSGSDMSFDGGKTWKIIDKLSYNSVQTKNTAFIWAVGDKGIVAKLLKFDSLKLVKLNKV